MNILRAIKNWLVAKVPTAPPEMKVMANGTVIRSTRSLIGLPKVDMSKDTFRARLVTIPAQVVTAIEETPDFHARALHIDRLFQLQDLTARTILDVEECPCDIGRGEVNGLTNALALMTGLRSGLFDIEWARSVLRIPSQEVGKSGQ